jgi:predicted GNAT family acetyltransferase
MHFPPARVDEDGAGGKPSAPFFVAGEGREGAGRRMAMLANGVVLNEAKSRYELTVDGVLAVCEYRRTGNRINFHHTLVPPELGGKGVGGRLVNAALDDAEAKGLEVEASCWFVEKALERRG